MTMPVAWHGRRLRRNVAVFSASAQKEVGAALCMSKVRTQSFIVRRALSALPFYCEE